MRGKTTRESFIAYVVPQFYNTDKIFLINVIVEVFYVVFTFTLVHVSLL